MREVLAWAADSGACLNVEVKPAVSDGGRTPETLHLLRVYGLERRVIVSSFQPLHLRAALECAPHIPRALLFEGYPLGAQRLLLALARRLKLSALHPHYPLITPALMALAEREGWRVNAWTVNGVAQARQLLGLGVSGLIGDLPQVLLEAAIGYPCGGIPRETVTKSKHIP